MNTIPVIATVADLQRRYRPLVDELKETGEPLVIVNHGEPDIVILDPTVYNAQVHRLKEIEEAYLLVTRDRALEEYKKGKTIKLGKSQKLIDLL
ncbi:MAG: type II toxin-antitoxin system prevent-host-death family antitoxin [Candidatus Gottesmanbacteria bacterium]|nr:type II toxin-antitoxin system prevent-host-death family antitoxin [Candidatus Gottesmanbacteria bacterium]